MTIIPETKDYDDYDYSVDFESNTMFVFDQYETNNSQLNILSHIYSSKQVQVYLKEFGFDQNDVTKWVQPIEVPIGIDTAFFIAREAIIHGLKFNDLYIYPELAAYTRGAKKIPDFVTDKCKSVSLAGFINAQPYQSFPEDVMTYKWKYQKGTLMKFLTL